MMTAARCLRVAGVASLPLLLLAASWAPLLQTPPQFDARQFRLNEDRWRALPEARREALRRRWMDYSGLAETDRERYAQRMGVLREMGPTLRRILGREPSQAELAGQLAQAAGPLQQWLAAECGLAWPVDAETLRSATERELFARVEEFLAGLVATGRISAGESARILSQDPSLMLRDALRLHADEQQPGGSEQKGLAVGADTGFASIPEQVRRSEREALENARSPTARGARDGQGGGAGAVDPLRLRMYKLAFLAEELRATGMPEAELREHLLKEVSALEAVVEEKLGIR